MEITNTLLGRIGREEAREITLSWPGRFEASILSYGAAIRRLLLPGRDGRLQNVVLGFDGWHDYIDNPLYAGATLCPNSGRIRLGRLPLGDSEALLTKNDGPHNLHGGSANASHRVWTVDEAVSREDYCSVTLSISLPDGADGYPGNRNAHIRYLLRDDMSLELELWAATDRRTYLNLSNHSYFNLSGDFTRSGLEQELWVSACSYIANDEAHLPRSVEACAGTSFDFSQPASLISNMRRYPDDPQLKNARGYNNAFLLEAGREISTPAAQAKPPARGPVIPPGTAVKKAATLADKASGRKLTLFTDAPCLVVYSGGYIGPGLALTGRAPSSASCAIALEAQDIPDVCHFQPAMCSFTEPGEPFTRKIMFRF